MTTLNVGRTWPAVHGIICAIDGAVSSALYERIAAFDMPWSCCFACVVDATIVWIRFAGSATSVASVARIAPTALPPPSSSFARTETGSIATSGAEGSAFCSIM